MFQKLDGHDVVFVYKDADGTTWLGDSMEGMMDTFGCDRAEITVRRLGEDVTQQYLEAQ